MLDKFQNYTIDFIQLNNFNTPSTEEPFLLTINKNQVKFEFLVRLKEDNDKAIIFGSGAYDAESDRNPPIFQRHKWMEHFNETLIYYNDPTLFLGQINMGWGFGFEERYYLQEIAEILEVLLKKTDIKKNNTLLYGSSAGGFMSLMLGGYLKNTKVLVNNPQTIVWNYYDRHVNNMFNCAHPTFSREAIIERYPERLNAVYFYKKINYVPSITYLQNVASKRDLTHHLNPFIVGLEKLDDNFVSDIDIQLYSDKESGHSPLRKQDSVNYIQKVLKKF